MAELTRHLREDPDAPDAFARACRLDGWLAKRSREERNGGRFRAALEEAERHRQPRRRGRRRLAWAAASAVAAAAIAVLCWTVFGSRYGSPRGKVRARVVGTEAVEVPAGKFACLAIESKHGVDGKEVTRTNWVAPGIGTVKESREDVTIALARVEAPAKPKPEQGAVALNTFDTDEPLRSPLFPRATWGGWMGEPGRSSDVEIDPFTGGANGTPFCLRWAYTTLGTWVSASISPGGEGPADLSKFKGISFYVKGLLGRPCTMTIQAKAADGEQRAFAHIRFQVTAQWQKIILTPDTHPELDQLDLRQVYSIGLTDAAREGAAHNVIWLDEVKLHDNIDLLLQEIEALGKIKRLLEGKKTEF